MKRRYNITLTPEAHRRLREMARAADISASSFLSLLIARAWAERGASLPAQAAPPAGAPAAPPDERVDLDWLKAKMKEVNQWIKEAKP